VSTKGLYEPAYEHDACGFGFVANIDGRKTHEIVRRGITVLENLAHRGACGCDPETGDGAGLLFQTPHRLFAEEAEKLGFTLPEPGAYAAGMAFLPHSTADRAACKQMVEKFVAAEGQRLLGWREVPRNSAALGWLAREGEPVVEQIFIERGKGLDTDAFERKLLVIRKQIERAVAGSGLEQAGGCYFPSLSARTIVYKGLMQAAQIDKYYLDLSDERFETAIALIHQRYSTNTMPKWHLAHPYRFICHNGEINTLRGNLNNMRSREPHLASPLLGADAKKLAPILTEGASDSANFDEAFELLVRGGRSLAHAIGMMIPEPWSGHENMPDDLKAFYEYHASMMEPWDGPAAVAFSDGVQVGAVLDRNGLRPSRYWLTDDNFIVLASEVGVLDIPETSIIKKGRLEPGRTLLIDTEEKRIVSNDEIKQKLAARQPYRKWINLHRASLPKALAKSADGNGSEAEQTPLIERQIIFGYTREDLEILIAPMANSKEGKDPVGSMGNDTPLAVLSLRPQLLFNYFKQLFAQVTNPPIDSIREEIVMSIETDIGHERNLLDETPEHCQQLHLVSPILSDQQLHYIKAINQPGLKTKVISTLFPVSDGVKGLEKALDRVCAEAEKAVDDGCTLIVLSDRGVSQTHAPMPILLAVGGVHHHLVRRQKRNRCGLIAETGEAREVMHVCLLTGYGAGAVNPYLAFETIEGLKHNEIVVEAAAGQAKKNFTKCLEKGLLKTMSKIGISTQHSYRNAQIFEAVGLNSALIARCFAGTASRVEGIGLEEIARETLARHGIAYPERCAGARSLDPGGHYRWRQRGEFHMVNPEVVSKLQHAAKDNSVERYREFSQLVNDRNRTFAALRGLLRFKFEDRPPVPLDEVEPANQIVRRFCTGAMSFGSISKEAHETLAIAMNRIGGRSNTGEGGEDPRRFVPDRNGDLRRSAIKQVASGRFGVTNEYLVNADELQIKMAQGAKPGEGGQLPGHKVFDEIAKVRLSTPGVELISPPPHHDIYSIEDLAQLIHDLKNGNVNAKVSVKLVSAVGVGTIAAGVAKGKSDLVLISGDTGGTGASPLSSIKHAGLPWELGLSETHQVLVENNLRSRIRVQTDGQMKTGRDVAIAFLLGADEVGFATMPLVATGCIMMRKCHLNTCPVGIATQDPILRKKFEGKPEYVVNYLFFVAEELREIMAKLGVRTVNEMIGHRDWLAYDPLPGHWKAKTLDLSRILYMPKAWEGETLYHSGKQDHGLEKALDHVLMQRARPAIEYRAPVHFHVKIRNINRTVGTMLSSELTRRHKLGQYTGKLPEDTVWIDCDGAAGQSFGAFAIDGVTFNVLGEANDYLGKGLSGGKIIVRPPYDSTLVPEENILIGNVALYGATGGECYVRGVAGERFCVRNSGAWAVVEGVGDHGCEYMTGGRAAILGRTGRNFAAGMSGGIAYVWDPDDTFVGRCNTGMVDVKPLHRESLPELRRMLRKHVKYTGSTVAKDILDHWEDSSARFKRVMPRDYARVIREIQSKEEEKMTRVPE
jgi:glutamate synthase domain-containing protein 2/glutamate synthase domain-containing protein 1/glutamate synthase domain-containing protein 3